MSSNKGYKLKSIEDTEIFLEIVIIFRCPMWDTVVNRYGSNSNCYFEPINEPYGYSSGDLNNMYADWLNRYSSIPDARVNLDGSGYATGVSNVGSDSLLPTPSGLCRDVM